MTETLRGKGTPTQQKKLGTGGRVLGDDESPAANPRRVPRRIPGGTNTSTSRYNHIDLEIYSLAFTR